MWLNLFLLLPYQIYITNEGVTGILCPFFTESSERLLINSWFLW